MSKRHENPTFLEFADAPEACARAGVEGAQSDAFRSLVDVHLLPVFRDHSSERVLTQDIRDEIDAIRSLAAAGESGFWGKTLFSRGMLSTIRLRSDTQIDFIHPPEEIAPAFYAAARNLISFLKTTDGEADAMPEGIPYFSAARVQTSSAAVKKFIEEQLARNQSVDLSKASEFARSAHYMGSKRNLAGFLVEAVSSVLPNDGIVVDLMCGSGAASGGFSRVWSTWASDAQLFCQKLALVQGAGFSVEEARQVLQLIVPKAQEHANRLREGLGEFMDWEDEILHGDISPRLLGEYHKFLGALPVFPSRSARRGWHPFEEVGKRKGNRGLLPYCLFSAYFANIFFGLRQCIEIDSVRWAIDQIANQRQRDWALGALIATLSALGTTYAAHFAQPRLKAPEKWTPHYKELVFKEFPKILEQRAFSVIHEFSVRLLSLAGESEKAAHAIRIVGGPWPTALRLLEEEIGDRKVVVYVDAPYKREEYSRYYHVLETLVTYDYPSSIGSGRMPDKKQGERFNSEFFTRSVSHLTASFARVICSILEKGWGCAWSYSDSGTAGVVEVVDNVCARQSCYVRSYSLPYVHKSQGRRQPKQVTEYLLVFEPHRDQGV